MSAKRKNSKPARRAAAPSTGRPRLNISETQVQQLASIDCSYEEIASIVGCSVSLLHKRFSTVIEKGRSVGKSSLKRMQFSVAMGAAATYDEQGRVLTEERKPSPTMLIWLGKIRLGQQERNAFFGGDGEDDKSPLIIIRTASNATAMPASVEE